MCMQSQITSQYAGNPPIKSTPWDLCLFEYITELHGWLWTENASGEIQGCSQQHTLVNDKIVSRWKMCYPTESGNWVNYTKPLCLKAANLNLSHELKVLNLLLNYHCKIAIPSTMYHIQEIYIFICRNYLYSYLILKKLSPWSKNKASLSRR